MGKRIKLNYQASEEKTNNLLLCLHGNSVDSNYFSTLLSGIYGWRVVAPDFIGHGESPILKPREYTFEMFIQCLVEFLDNFNYKKLVIIGHSMGGNLAIELMNVVRVDGVLLLTSAPISYTSSLAPYLKLPDLILTEDEDENLALIEQFLWNFGSTQSTINYLKRTFFNTDPVFRDRLLEEFGAQKFSDHLELLKKHKSTPIGCIIGLDDVVVNNQYLIQLNTEGSFDFFAEIQDAGHYSLLEKPKENYQAILSFIQKF